MRRPMSPKEVAKLEKQVGLPMPEPFRDYLLELGLFQDLTRWEVSPIEVYEDASDFVAARRFLSELLPRETQLFPFGGDGAGNVYCLPTGKGTSCRIQFVDHETEKITAKKDFTVWLQDVVAKVLRGIRKRVPNERKVWAVQFSFSDTAYRDLVKVLRSAGKFKEIDRVWKKTEASDDDMTTTERVVALDGERVKVEQMECADWDGPMLSFDMREQLVAGQPSRIRSLDRLFNAKLPGYALVDYGPLDLREIENEK
jgi:SMI1 / KNR4 family (SUKH-1)